MFHCFPGSLFCLLVIVALRTTAFPSLPNVLTRTPSLLHRSQKNVNIDTNPNGSTFIWVIEDTYGGKTFFDRWSFYTGPDPTNGQVTFVNESYAFANGLAAVTADGKAIMQGDNTTRLTAGEYRKSVRISSNATYNTGLFILDLNKAPWGCGVWPAFWTVGSGQWPYNGEIDIIEGVHDNEHNQVTWHTGPGCNLSDHASFTGTVVQNNGKNNTNCDGLIPPNSGCGITEWSRASYGPIFDAQSGGVFAMKWDENGIAVWSFYRAAIPQDILNGEPNTSLWGTPVAFLSPSGCDPLKYFVNHSIIFDITFCGDWAGNSYAFTTCPGTCSDRLMDPANFVNATWIINTLKVYRKQPLTAASGTKQNHMPRPMWILFSVALSSLTILATLL